MSSPDPRMNQPSLQLKRGLSDFGYSDHYAVLGMAVDSPAGEIRKRYMKLARMLHPDSYEGPNKEQASQVLSKLVNPAYQVLSQEKERNDYTLLLKLVGQRANLEIDTVKLSSPSAKELLTSDEYESYYQSAIQNLAQQQYKELSQSVDCIEQMSELNLAFLLRREGTQGSRKKYPEASAAIAAEPISPTASITTQAREPAAVQSAAQPSTSEGYVKQYLRRAEDLSAKKLYPAAIQELKDALRLDPQNVRCHALMGTFYLKQNQPKMAKGHLTQALKLDPNNAEARQAMTEVQKQEAQAAKVAPSGAKTLQSGAKATQAGVKPPGRRGLFGLFGGKK
jgi:tetratricopeptide (TPR) repeat protein